MAATKIHELHAVIEPPLFPPCNKFVCLLQEIKNLHEPWVASVHVLQVYHPYDLPNLRSTVRAHWKMKVPVFTHYLHTAKQDLSFCVFFKNTITYFCL